MNPTLLTLFVSLLLGFAAPAQQAKGQLDIQLNKNMLQPGDSLLVAAKYTHYEGQSGNPSLATLALVIENEQGMRTRLRWPLINGQVSGALYLPDSLPRGKYTLVAGLQQRFFEVMGKVQNPPRSGNLSAMLLTKNGQWDQQPVSLSPDGTFAIRNWLFEENALIAFSSNNQQPLDIRISTHLDSSYEPLAVTGTAFYLGNTPAGVQTLLNPTVATPNSLFAEQGTVLPAVVVRTTAKSPAQQFNEQYASGLFRSGDERLISILDDPGAPGFANLFAYLQGRVAGLQIAAFGPNGGMARWRGSPVTFFLDEMRVSAQQIATVPVADIAIVKAFPPPFLGAPGGGGALAIYTRRGGEANYLPANRQVFRIRGYTPLATILNMDKLGM